MALIKKTEKKLRAIALLGNPNCGKTTLFNALTGLRHSTANYPGVTVEKKTAVMTLAGSGEKVTVLDLPGAYSLLPRSMDEEVVHDVLMGVQEGTPAPDLVVLVLDANNLERNLYLASQVFETGLRVVLALNMWDMAEANGLSIDLGKLRRFTGCPVIKMVANRKIGVPALKEEIEKQLTRPESSSTKGTMELFLPPEIEEKVSDIGTLLSEKLPGRGRGVRGEAIRLLSDSAFRSPLFRHRPLAEDLRRKVLEARAGLETKGIDWGNVESESRYAQIESVCQAVIRHETPKKPSVSERLDYVFTHRVWGLAIFLGLMGLIFQSIFSWAGLPMEWISFVIDRVGGFAGELIPDGQLESLIADGIIAGVGNVLVFLPQIFLLFFFIALFEDFGYMARAAFVLDRLMKKAGLNGRAFLPLLSCFACAVPGIMATRTIEDRNDRLATILVAPLMSCSARLPVYTLMIAAFIPDGTFGGIFNLKGITLLSMYLLSIGAGLGMASLFRNTFLKGERSPFIFELPPYRIPDLKTVFSTTWDRGKEFIYRAGSIIFCFSIILWFLVSYPKSGTVGEKYEQQEKLARRTLSGQVLEDRLKELEHNERGEEIRLSFAGRLGRLIEPAIQPLGFDWKIGIGLIGSLAAREVLVSTLAIVYHVGEGEDETSVSLIEALKSEVSPETGRPIYTPLTAVSLMVFFVLACQCMSTVVMVKRETNSWRWPVFMVLYMTALAWVGSFTVYQTGRFLGWGV